MKNLWKELKEKNKAITCSAPMSGVSDVVFRQMLVKYGKPDVIFTEFVSVDGLDSDGKDELMKIMKYEKNERPVVVQFFGRNPENFYKAAKLAKKLGFDGIDINMGCPDRSVSGKQGAGSALMKDISLACEIIKATKKGAGNIPVSVKMRLGWNKKDISKWILDIAETGVSAITIHGRTKTQGYSGEADWDEIEKVTKIIKEKYPDIVVIGNGDIITYEDGECFVNVHKTDGFMVGRRLIGHPWWFGSESKHPNSIRISTNNRLKVALEHTELFEKYFGDTKNFESIKKHYAAYIRGFDGAKEIRQDLMQIKDIKEAKKYLKNLV